MPRKKANARTPARPRRIYTRPYPKAIVIFNWKLRKMHDNDQIYPGRLEAMGVWIT